MTLALRLGARGVGQVWPNPAVGCVIVRDGRVLGRGWTQPGGRPHAETVALAQAGTAARGATAYVTLEPCAHFGRTPPCADALLRAGVARVVVAVGDPDPRVNGGGVRRLREAGTEVHLGVMEAEAREAQKGFLMRVTSGRPALALKLANSMDGRIATASGESRWITGPQARRKVHALRARHDAVMVGGGTARADDPDLTVRGWPVARQPVRIVVSRGLDLPPGSRLMRSAAQVPVWLCHGPDAPRAPRERWQDAGARCLEVPLNGAGQIDARALMRRLGQEGLTRVFCEGGGMFAASLLGAGLVDDLYAFGAGLALGAEARPAVGSMGLDALAMAPRFRLVDLSVVGDDTLAHWRASPSPGS